MKRILIVVNYAEFFLSHRLPIARAAVDAGYNVCVATADGERVAEIEAAGLKVHRIPFTRSGVNPLRELSVLVSLYRLFCRLRPDLVHLVSIKPLLYGGIAARLARVPAVVMAVSGLGYLFTNDGGRTRVLRGMVSGLYRLALGGHGKLCVICQNPDDREVVQRLGAINDSQVVMIPGSGVDLSVFMPRSVTNDPPVVLMASRLLRDKGVEEFIAAARLLLSRGAAARFVLVGDVDADNPATVSADDVAAWQREGMVECWGFRNDMAAVMNTANIVVLPSYREGLPKVLLEAAASGRAVVATDVPGCRDAVEAGVTGLLVPPRDPVALAEAIGQLLSDSELRDRMGRAGRALAERKFSIESVVDAHLRIYEEVLQDI